MSTSDTQSFEAMLPAMMPVLRVVYENGREVGREEGRAEGQQQGYQVGFQQGMQAGRQLGFVEGVNALTPAVSDGLRHGSPVCGSMMQGLKNLGLRTEETAVAASAGVVVEEDGDDIFGVVHIGFEDDDA